MEAANLSQDKACGSADAGFASHFVTYGVRWNDLPPFRLKPDEGNCNYLGKAVCRVDQTVRFSTQPLCWYCLFKDAETTATKKKIAGCHRGNNVRPGNLMTRSHFGDLQFLHGMSSEEGEDPIVTQAKILGWLEFAWKVATKEIKSDIFLRTIQIPVIQEHFGCTEWRVSDLYILGHQDSKTGLIQKIHEIAFGSVLHTVQDSFAGAHTTREDLFSPGVCDGSAFEKPPNIVEFHTYASQDGGLHDEQDSRHAFVNGRAADTWPHAVVATRNLVDLFQARASWSESQGYIRCLFDMVDSPNRASAGELYKRMKDR